MKRAVLVFAWLLMATVTYSQFSLSGTVVDEKGNPLPGANLVLSGTNFGVVSGSSGEFRFEGLERGSYQLKISFVGYEDQLEQLELNRNLELGSLPLSLASILGEEVIVRGTRAGSKTPVAYAELDREEILSQHVGQDIPYLLSSTPSLVTSSDAGHGIGYTSMRIRGTDANRINVTINGIPLNDAESHSVYWVDLPDIATSVDNIQIQRGVGTSTNGASAFGASVNFQTRKLEKEPYAVYEGNLGSFRTYRNAISAGTGLIKDHFTIDLRLSGMHSDGYMDRSWTNLQSHYLAVGYFDEKTLIKFVTFSGTEELYQAWNGVPSSLLESNRTYNELGAYTDESGSQTYYDRQVDHYRQDHYQLHFSHEIGERFYLNSALHYTRGSGYYEQYKEDESYADYLLQDVILSGDTIRETDLIRRKWLENDFYGLVGGLHFQDEGISAVLGGGWNRYDGDHFGTVIWARVQGNEEIRHRWYENRGIKSDWNSYFKSTIDAGQHLSFFADLQLRGINYSIEGADDDLRNITQDHQYLFFNPKAGLNIQVDKDQRVYLFVARANREPNRSNFVDADPSGPVPVKESMLDYEAGYTLQGKGFGLNGNLYFMDYTNQLVLTGEINDVGAAIMTNVKDSYRAGIELSIATRFSSWLHWDASATFSRNKILDYSGYVDNWDYWSDPDNESYQILEKLGATDLSFSPELILKSQFNVEPLESLNIGLVSSYVGKQYIDNSSSEDRILSPYFINDLVISYTFFPEFMEEVSLRLKVANLFDAEYETNAWVYRYYSGGMEGVLDGYYPQAGTHIMAGVRLRF